MPALFTYLLKLSVSLAVVFLFYQLVLRRLTFYNWNRWYLLGYTFLSFFIPFIDISGILQRNELTKHEIINWVPAITVHITAEDRNSITGWDGILLFFLIGVAIMLTRLCIQLISFYRMKRKAVAVAENGLNIFHVNENIIPFSFGNSIFINQNLHSESELEEIIRHEFIHVKQRHSLDIIWGELLCLLNWYNPFAWLLKRSIRQNLEFIADNKVIENGINKKEYQYLLLKVIGNTQFSIATQFNFSSLKKRIAMMNKTKSAKLQVGRFLFLLPVCTIVLLSFRKTFSDHPIIGKHIIAYTDTVPDVKEPNSKGFYIDIKDNNGDCMVVVKDKTKKEVTRLLLTDWDKKADYYETLYGEILTPCNAQKPVVVTAVFDIDDDKAIVRPANGAKEVYNLKNEKEKKQFIEKYGEPAIVNVSPNVIESVNVKVSPEVIMDLKKEIVSNKELTTVKNVNLDNVIVSTNVVNAKIASPVKVNSSTIMNLKGVTAIAPMDASEPVIVADEYDHTIGGKEEVLVTITKNTTRKQLDDLIKQVKEKGIELAYDEIEYDKDKLVKLTGTMKSPTSNGNFSAIDFEKLILSIIEKGNKTYFKVTVQDKKIAI